MKMWKQWPYVLSYRNFGQDKYILIITYVILYLLQHFSKIILRIQRRCSWAYAQTWNIFNVPENILNHLARNDLRERMLEFKIY